MDMLADLAEVDRIFRTLLRLDRWQQIVFGGGCAQRGLPLVELFAVPETTIVVGNILDELWASQGDIASERANVLLGLLEQTEEYDINDSSDPRYEAMTSLLVLSYVLQVAQERDLYNHLGALSTDALSAQDPVWSVLQAGPDNRRHGTFDGREVPSELESQTATLRILQEERSPEDRVIRVREVSVRHAVELRRLLPAYCRELVRVLDRWRIGSWPPGFSPGGSVETGNDVPSDTHHPG